MATALPAATDFTGATVTEGQYKTAMTNLRAYLAENMGTTGGGNVDATSGAVFRHNVLINGQLEIWQRGTTSISCTAGARTFLADRWYVNPTGAAVTQARSTTVRSGASVRYSLELAGAASVTTVLIGQRIESADIPPIARTVTFQCYVYNGSGSAFTPSLLLGTPGAADNFTTVTNRLTQALQSCPDAAWTQVSHTVNISAYTNLANGLQVELQIPSGSLVSGDTVRVAEMQLAPSSVVSELEIRSIQNEFDLCQRFYVVGVGYRVDVVTSSAATLCSTTVTWPTKMRAAPVVTRVGETGDGTFNSFQNTTVFGTCPVYTSVAAVKYGQATVTADAEL